MIIDLDKFIAVERPFWTELETLIDKMAEDPAYSMDLRSAQRFHYLYERAAAGLGKVSTFASEPETRRYLESLVARAHEEIHEVRDKSGQFHFWRWLSQTFPQTFRRRINAFWLSLAITLVGCGFGGLAITLDPEAKQVIVPFSHLAGDPSQRVAQEEKASKDRMAGVKTSFSAMLMTHNTRVCIYTLALGMTYGVGTLVMLFYNGVILGAVSVDYIAAGQTKFLVGWLLPHGSFEIPAILIAGQAGLLLGGGLIGWGRRASLRQRLRELAPDLVTLIFGAAALLVWAGFVESFFSQYHQPVIPYWLKIGFGCTELVLLSFFLARSGAATKPPYAKSQP